MVRSRHYLHHCGQFWKSKDSAALVLGLGTRSSLKVKFKMICHWKKLYVLPFKWEIFPTKWIGLYFDIQCDWPLTLSFVLYFFFKKKKMRKQKKGIILNFFICGLLTLWYTTPWQSPYRGKADLTFWFYVLFWWKAFIVLVFYIINVFLCNKKEFLFTEDTLWIYDINVFICGICWF